MFGSTTLSTSKLIGSAGIIISDTWNQWNHDMPLTPSVRVQEYNKNDPSNIYRPWGFQPGHQKLCWNEVLGLPSCCKESGRLALYEFLRHGNAFLKIGTSIWTPSCFSLRYVKRQVANSEAKQILHFLFRSHFLFCKTFFGPPNNPWFFFPSFS